MKTKTILLTALMMSMFIATAFSQVEKFQAAYLINFTRFIEWPSDYLSGNFVIGVLGNDPVVKELQSAASTKTVYGRKLEIKVFTSPDAIVPTHILYVTSGQSERVSSAAGKISGQNTLLVSYGGNGINDGSGINFVFADNKLQFDIKKSNIVKYNLKINSELETLAKRRF